MEQLILLVVFLVIAGLFSVIKKVQEQVEQEKRRQERERRQEAEGLPEATRRLLYGNEEPERAAPDTSAQPLRGRREWRPPVAVPRGRPTQPVVPPPVPPAPSRRAKPIQQRAPQPRVPRPQRPAKTAQRRVPQPPGTPVSVHEVLRRGPQARPAAKPAQRPAPESPQRPRPRARRRPTAAPPPQRPAPHRVKRKRAPAKALFSGLDDIRQGVVMREILGPPVSMR